MPANVFKYSLFQLSTNGIILAAIFGGMYFGSPFSWGTYSTRMIQRQSRSEVFGGKLVALLVSFISWLFTGLLVAHIVSFSLGYVEGALAYNPPAVLTLLRSAVLIILIWFTWSLVGGALSLWTGSTAMGIGLSLAYFFLERIIIFAIPGFSSLIEGYTHFFLGQASSLTSNQLFEFEFMSQAEGMTGASLLSTSVVILGYMIGLVLVAWWRFSHMELAEG